MNYKLIYDTIIDKALKSNRKKNTMEYFEVHHILPKCMGGENKKYNLVLLTAKEHYVCHHLLTKIYPQSDAIQIAFSGMCYKYCKEDKRFYNVTSIVYQNAKKKHSDIMRKRIVTPETRLKMSESGKVKNFSDQHRENMSKTQSKREKQPAQGLVHTEESLKLMSLKQSGENNGFYGKSHSEESRKLISDAHTGKQICDEQKKKISETMSTLKWYNDGIKSVRLNYHPGDGWDFGRLTFKRNKSKNKEKE